MGRLRRSGRRSGDLVDELSLLPQINRIVLDQTGLKGYYDFTLRWTQEGPNPPGVDPGQRPGNAPGAGFFGDFDLHRDPRSTWTKAGIAKGTGRDRRDRARRRAFAELTALPGPTRLIRTWVGRLQSDGIQIRLRFFRRSSARPFAVLSHHRLGVLPLESP